MPFAHLKPLYREILAKLQFVSLIDIQVGVPTDFYGIEKDIIIISHLRNSQVNQLGQFTQFKSSTGNMPQSDSVESTKILNLALTRAKRFLWLVGNLQHITNTSVNFTNLAKHFIHSAKKGHRSYEAFESYD